MSIHYWVGLSINSLASIAFFFTLTKMVANGRRGGRSAASMLLFRSPDGGALSTLASPQLPLTSQRSTFHGKIFRLFFGFYVSECFPKSVSAPKRKPRIAERWELKKTVFNLGPFEDLSHLDHVEDLSQLDHIVDLSHLIQFGHIGRLGQPWSHKTFDQSVPESLTFQTNKSCVIFLIEYVAWVEIRVAFFFSFCVFKTNQQWYLQ